MFECLAKMSSRLPIQATRPLFIAGCVMNWKAQSIGFSRVAFGRYHVMPRKPTPATKIPWVRNIRSDVHLNAQALQSLANG